MSNVISQCLISSRFHRLSKIQMPKVAVLLFVLNLSILAQIDDSWLGIWQGELNIESSPLGLRNSIPMELHISKTDTAGIWDWRIVYRDSANDDRKYLLKTVDKEAGKYIIDETDGILLEAGLFRNKLISRIEVMDALLEISYTLDEEKIYFEVSSSKVNPTSVTQSQAEQIEVKSYEVTGYQTAILYKHK